MPSGTARARIHAIEEDGAEVHVVDGSYDDAVRLSATEAAAREKGARIARVNDWVKVYDSRETGERNGGLIEGVT